MNSDEARRAILRSFTYGLYLVGTRSDEGPYAFTATWVSQASMKPPLVSVGVRKDSAGDRHIRVAGVFTLNVLAEGQKEMAATFFKCPKAEDGRFAGVPFRLADNGCPVFEQTLGTLECETVRDVDEGDHRVYVARVVNATAHQEKAPLALAQTGWTYGG